MAPDSDITALPAGTLIGSRYKVVKELGRGGYGVVYLAEDTKGNNLKVAIKEQHKNTPEALALFRAEAALLEKLSHPNLVKVLNFFEADGRPYLVMDFIDGQDIMSMVEDAYHQGTVMDTATVIKIMLDVCDAVAYLHARVPPIIHRDIKPSNLRMNSKGQPILVDFGISKIGSATETVDVAKAVTQGFSPPEQYSGLGHTNTSSDVYALGATMWCMLTSAIPTPGAERLIKNTPLLSVRGKNPRVSPELEGVILKAMSLNVLDRYKTAGEMLTALQMVSGMPVQGYEGGTVCPNCQQPSRKGAKFCSRCGSNLAGGATQCLHCGYPMRAGALFCAKCGHRNPTTPPDTGNARQHILAGDKRLQQHDLKAAAHEYQMAYHLGIKDPDLFSRLGGCFLELKEFDDAVSMLEDAVRLFPSDVHLLTQLAIAYWQSDKRSQGMQLMEQACRLEPGNVDLVRQVVVMYMELYKYADAIPILERLLEYTKDPEDAFRLAICYLKVDRASDAEGLLRKLQDKDKHHPGVLYYLGIVHMKKNKPRDALKYFSETVKYDPDHALAYYYMGDILRAERKFKDAAEAFLQSLKADPCDPDTYVQLAICMIELHQPNEAKEAIRRALQLDPQHELGLKIGQQMGIA